MKFLLLYFRKKLVEFYGKCGINWYVIVVIRKMLEFFLLVDVFVYVFDSCDQDQIVVVLIIQNILFIFRKLYLELIGVYFRLDNVGCYYGGYFLISFFSIGYEIGIRVIGYDFSEV